MSSYTLKKMFEHISDAFQGTGRRQDFVWHGGEPMLQERTFYEEIARMQAETLGARGIAYTNSVQTNLTRLSPDSLSLFRSFFQNVGVSIDVFGEQRVDAAGRQSQQAVLENMQALRDEGIRFGCITVLSRVNVDNVEAIYQFFEDLGISFRLLPIYRTGYDGQQDPFALTADQIVEAMIKAVDRWFTSRSDIHVEPIQDYIIHVLRKLAGTHAWRRYYDKTYEVVLIVDTNGNVYSNGDAYDLAKCHGNIARQTWGELRESVGFNLALAESKARLEEVCGPCSFHGYCSGYFMAEATPEQRWRDKYGRIMCGVAQPVQSYVETMLASKNIVDTTHATLRIDQLMKLANETGGDARLSG